MNRLLLTDTHFGWKQNSTTWLNSQIAFLRRQIIPYLKEHPKTTIIHLGDVFDSRSSISPYVAKEVRECFIEIAKYADDFFIIAGNHDFYSPNSAEYESLSMVFRDCGKNLHLVIDEVFSNNFVDLYIPWYQYKYDLTKILDEHPNARNIYTHADIFGADKKPIEELRGCKVFAGHIHTPQFKDNLYNLGSCFPLDFNDANHDRFFYIYDDEQLLPYTNKGAIKFWRLKNETIFDQEFNAIDYYELYINQANLSDGRYQERIKEISNICRNFTVIPIIDSISFDGDILETYDINTICKELIPKHLEKKFKQVIESV